MPTYSDPYQVIKSYIDPNVTGPPGPRGLSHGVRQAAGRALGYQGPYGQGGHGAYMAAVPALEPFMGGLTGRPDAIMHGGISELEHQALARMYGYSGPFGQGGHAAWLDKNPSGDTWVDWNDFRSRKIEELGLAGTTNTQRYRDYQDLLDQLATQKSALGGSFIPAPPPVTSSLSAEQPTVDVFPRINTVSVPTFTPDQPYMADRPFDSFAGGFPTSYWELAGLGSDAGTGAPHTQYLPERGVYLGDLRLASRLMGFDKPFGGGRQYNWAQQQFGGWDPVEAQAMAVEQARRAYEAQAYGIDPLRWTKPGPLPHEIDPRFNVPFGVSRSAMRDLGFGDDFGAGRGNEFVGMLTPDIVEQALHLLRYPAGPHRLDEVTLAPMQATPPPDDTAFQPNYALFYNPALMNAMTGEGMFPQYDAPWFGEMPMGNGGDTNGGSSGAGRFLGGQAGQGGFELSPDLQELANQEWIAAPPGHHSPVIRNPFFIGYRYGTRKLPLQYPLDNT